MNYKNDELLRLELQIKDYEETLNKKKSSLSILEEDIENLEKRLAQLKRITLSMISNSMIIKKKTGSKYDHNWI